MDTRIYIKNSFEKLLTYLEKRDFESIHQLENKVLEQAISESNIYYSEFCIILYGLRKLIKKRHIYLKQEWKVSEQKIIEKIEKSKDEKDLKKIYEDLLEVQKIISDIDSKLGNYITHIIESSRVKLASTAYAYGLSAAQASELFSCSKEELMSFIGNTKMPDEDKLYESIEKRIHLLDVVKKNENL